MEIELELEERRARAAGRAGRRRHTVSSEWVGDGGACYLDVPVALPSPAPWSPALCHCPGHCPCFWSLIWSQPLPTLAFALALALALAWLAH